MKLNTALIALVIFLLASNVSTIFTFRKHLKEEQALAEKRTEIPDTRVGRYFKEELNLNSEQIDQFREFRRLYNRSANTMLTDMQDLRNKMAVELNTKVPNRKKLNDLAFKLGCYHKDLKGLTFDYYFNMQSVLDADQQDEMVGIFQAMLTEQGIAKTPNHTIRENGDHRGGGRGRNNKQESNIDSTDEDNVFEKFEEN